MCFFKYYFHSYSHINDKIVKYIKKVLCVCSELTVLEDELFKRSILYISFYLTKIKSVHISRKQISGIFADCK